LNNSKLDRIAVVAGVAFLLAILVTQLALSIRQESITWDEDDHIYSGYMSLKTGEFGLNPEHPPLVKMLAMWFPDALPAQQPAEESDRGIREEVQRENERHLPATAGGQIQQQVARQIAERDTADIAEKDPRG